MDNKAEIALRIARDSRILSFDTETSGLDWRRNQPIGYVLCDADTLESVYVPIRHGGGGNIANSTPLVTPTDRITPHQFEKDLANVLSRRDRPIVGHNLKFDTHFAMNAGISLGRHLSCTQNNEVLIDEHASGYSLEACATRHGLTPKKSTEVQEHLSAIFGAPADRKLMARFWETSGSDPVVVSYAEGDGIVTAQLYHAQLALVQEQELGAVKALEDALIWTLVRMERRGLRVDTAYLEQLLEEVRKRAAQALEKLPPGFNPRSCTKVKALAEAAGHTDWPLTANGNPSFSERFLSSFPEGQNVVALRKWTHLENSFIGPLLSEHVHNGRVHAIFNQLKSDEFGTPARLSCSSPNLQQIPKRDKEIATLFRRAFVPDPGMVFYEADWSQAEPRLFAHYSKEPKLIDGYTKEPFRDIHQLTADLLGVPRNPTGKRMAMGILTGMQPRSFADHMGWPLDKAAMMWHKWFEAFPEIRRFQQQARSVMGARGYVKTLLGRRGRLDKPRFAYRAVSRIIQGSSADILKLKLLQIDRMLEDDGDRAHVLCTVHDSIAWQAPDGPIGEELSAHIVQCMEDVQSPPINLRVPFVAEVGRGPDWSVASFGDDHG